MDNSDIKRFSTRLLRWHSTVKRPMPWKGEKNPYKVWVSEIMLQQTRVEQGWNYYSHFLKRFPTVAHLAKADEQDVLQQWEGLGYYTRARNLHHSAKFIVENHKGKFPATYDEIIELKGVGPYTAAAIASFAFDLPHAVVDGNVSRVLARYFGIYAAIDSPEGKKIFFELANTLIPKKTPGLFNQAMMDLGAIICKPSPVCSDCPFQKDCFAKQNDLIPSLPVRRKKAAVRHRHFTFYVFQYKNKILLRQRTEKDIWKGLFQFPMEEVKSAVETSGPPGFNKMIPKRTMNPVRLTQLLTHQLIQARFYSVSLRTPPIHVDTYFWAKKEELKIFPMPKIIREYVKKYLS